MIDKIEIDACYNLDCNIGMRLMKEQGLIADWCIADPPYSIGYTKMTGGVIILLKGEYITALGLTRKYQKIA